MKHHHWALIAAGLGAVLYFEQTSGAAGGSQAGDTLDSIQSSTPMFAASTWLFIIAAAIFLYPHIKKAI